MTTAAGGGFSALPPVARRPAAWAPLGAVLWVAVLGGVQSLALVHTGLWWLALACLAGLAWGVLRATPGRAALLGWAYGCASLLATVWWLFISMHRYGHLPAVLAAAAVFALSAALSLYLAAAMAWVAWRRSGGRPGGGDALRFAAAWLVAELARGQWFTGFPWGAAGYGQVDGPLAALAPWVGVYGMGAVLALVAAVVAAVVAAAWPVAARPAAGSMAGQAASRPAPAWRQAGPPLAAALALLAGPALLGPVDFTQPSGRMTVALLQPNVAQDEKFAAERLPATLAWVGTALRTSQADLVLAPETAVPLLPGQLEAVAPGYWAALAAHFSRPGGPAALVGVPLGDERTGYTNSVVGLGAGLHGGPGASRPGVPPPAAAPYRYDKVHLVPFGEFIPTGFRWFTEAMAIPLGDFARGPLNAPSFAVRGERIAPNICYEDLFGEELARRFTVAATAPTVLANVSNIGWFGDSVAVPQHLGISRLRSLELQRPMLRATNTGATAVVDHRGRVTATLAPFSAGVLNASVQGRTGLTPFARWAGAAGLWPLWALAAGVLAWPRRWSPFVGA